MKPKLSGLERWRGGPRVPSSTAISNQIDQEVEHLGFDGNKLAIAPKFTPIGVKYLIFNN